MRVSIGVFYGVAVAIATQAEGPWTCLKATGWRPPKDQYESCADHFPSVPRRERLVNPRPCPGSQDVDARHW